MAVNGLSHSSENGDAFTPERVSMEPYRCRQSWWQKPRGWAFNVPTTLPVQVVQVKWVDPRTPRPF